MTGPVTITRGARRAAAGLLVLMIIVGSGNLWASYAEVQTVKAAQLHNDEARKRAGSALEVKLCTTFGKLSGLRPPPGDPVKNPSRAYEQKLHDTLVQLGADLGCKQG